MKLDDQLSRDYPTLLHSLTFLQLYVVVALELWKWLEWLEW